MAEIQSQTGDNRKKNGVRRSKKLSTKVDMTPMVDLGFLLITFFILTINWSEPNALTFVMRKSDGPAMTLAESTALTVIPISNDRIFFYHGQPQEAVIGSGYGVTGYDISTGIGEVIRKKQSQLNLSKRFTSKDLMLVIKPSTDCNYKNIVDVMDEVKINGVSHYAVADLSETEKEMLKNFAAQRAYGRLQFVPSGSP